LRDEYENIFVGLIDVLSLRKGSIGDIFVSPSSDRYWFKNERDTLAAMVKQILQMLRTGVIESQ
jgi:hypothetical protein